MREMIPKNVGSRKVGNSRTKAAKDDDYETYERVSKRKTTTTVYGHKDPLPQKPMLSKVMIGGGFIQKILPIWDSIVVGGSKGKHGTPHFLILAQSGMRTNAPKNPSCRLANHGDRFFGRGRAPVATCTY
jgi:hypothetical protein